MDFNLAIDAHVEWVAKLAYSIANSDKCGDLCNASDDRNCELGEWLYGDGQKFSRLPEYATLVAIHARFHREAGAIQRAASEGRVVSSDMAIGSGSNFDKMSLAVICALVKMNSLVGAESTCASTSPSPPSETKSPPPTRKKKPRNRARLIPGLHCCGASDESRQRIPSDLAGHKINLLPAPEPDS